MKKFYLLIFIIILIPFEIKALVLPDLNSDKVLLYDLEDNKILYEKESSNVTSIASLTKIMTTIVAIEKIESLDSYVTVTRKMLSEVPYDASIAGLKVNDKVTYRDLLYATMLPSGADAAYALAYLISGSEKEYVELMNDKAISLGMENTHFVNVTGYDDLNHYSTAQDVLKLLLYSLKNNLFNEIYKEKTYTLSNGLKVESTLNKYNRYYDYDLSFILGSKTGYTGDAGMCMSSIINIDDKDLVLITLNAPYKYGKSLNIEDSVTVYNYLKSNYSTKILYKKDDVLLSIPIKYSNITNFNVTVKESITKYVENIYNPDDFRYEYEGLNELSYKNKKNSKIGNVRYYYKDELIKEEDVILDIELKISYVKYLKAHIYIVVIGVAVLLVVIYIISLLLKKRLN